MGEQQIAHEAVNCIVEGCAYTDVYDSSLLKKITAIFQTNYSDYRFSIRIFHLISSGAKMMEITPEGRFLLKEID